MPGDSVSSFPDAVPFRGERTRCLRGVTKGLRHVSTGRCARFLRERDSTERSHANPDYTINRISADRAERLGLNEIPMPSRISFRRDAGPR